MSSVLAAQFECILIWRMPITVDTRITQLPSSLSTTANQGPGWRCSAVIEVHNFVIDTVMNK